LTTYTYNILLQRSWALPKEVRQHNVDLIRRLRGSSDSSIRTPATIVEDVGEGEINESELSSGETAKPIDFGEDLVAILRYLKKHVARDKTSDTTHPFTLVNFMSMYLATGRTLALKMLLDKAIRKSFFATSNFLFAEMLLYRRLKQPNLVIKTFMDHFWLSGVPREEVMIRYLRIDSIYRNYDSSSGEDPPLQRFYPFDSSYTLPRGKIWPSKRHCNLIWDALVELTTNDRQLEVLYKKLIDFAEQGFDSPRSEVVVKADEVPIPGHWHAPVGAAAFTPFMQRLMFAQGPSFGVRILRDMLQLGIPPTTYHYTELAGFYARKGDDPKVFLILDGMERGRRRDLPERNTNTPQRGISGPVEEYYLPPPTLVTYTSILRGFLIAKHLDGAEKVFARLKSFCDYVPGQAATLDLAIQDLEDFSKAGATWVCCHFLDGFSIF
jgi:pentatricopeptide repeat protein